jgi:outer membrane protein
MKNLFLFLIIILNTSNVFAQNNVYFLDIDYVLNNSNEGKNIIEELKKKNLININNLKEKEQELKILETDISKLKNIISENEFQNKVNTLKKKLTEYRKQKDEISKEFIKLKDKKLTAFLKKISPFIQEYMNKNSISVLLDKKNIFIADSKYDITDTVIKILNEQN